MADTRRAPAGAHRHGSTGREVLLAALIGAGIVALWFFAMDVIRGQLLFTPAALGSFLFYGARGVGEVRVDALTVIGYTIIHVAAFAGVALIAVRIVHGAEQEPRALLGMGIFFIVLEVFVVGLLAIAAGWLLDALSLWAVALSTLAAGAGMAMFLWARHPLLRQDLTYDLEEQQ